MGLALFAIWMLNRTYREQRERLCEEREQLMDSLERNTTAWVAATEALARMSTVMVFLANKRAAAGEPAGED